MSIFIKNAFLRLIPKGINNQQQVRLIPRWSHRRPVKVLAPEEFEDLEKRTDEKHTLSPQKSVEEVEFLNYKMKLEQEMKPLKIVKKAPRINKSVKATDMLETVLNSDGTFVYTKMQNKDPRIAKLLTELKSGNLKAKSGKVLLEGKRLIEDALKSNCKLRYLLFSRTKEVEYLKAHLPKTGAKLYKMPYKEMQMWSDLTTTPGIMGIFDTPDTTKYVAESSLPLMVICDNIREPGNLGAVLRSCAGVGCEKVILTKGCVNLWDWKVLRSSSGTHFHLQIHTKKSWDEIKEIIEPESDVFIADNKIVTSSSEKTDVEGLVKSILILPYYGVDYTQCKHIVLVVGGETEGISEESYKFAAENSGSRLNVPLMNDVESLNTGTALGIIAFEIKRQIAILQARIKQQN